MSTVTTARQHPWVTAIVAALLGLIVLALGTQLVGDPDPHTWMAHLGKLPAVALAIILLVLVGRAHSLSPAGTRWAQIITCGWPVFLMGLVIAALGHLSPADKGLVPVSVIVFLVGIALTVLFEETLCRGVIQGTLTDAGIRPMRAVLGASAIFAIMHLANLISQPTLVVGTFTQVIYTFCLGALLGAIYLTSDSLWVPMILHAVFNALGELTVITRGVAPAAQGAPADTSIVAAAILIILSLPLLVVALVMLRRREAEARAAQPEVTSAPAR